MKTTRKNVRRLILGMSVEDAQSKFDSPESRLLLRLSHERHNQGVLRELQVAQHQRDYLPSERKCHISRFAKPTCKGFQAYIKSTPDDYIVRELWSEETVPAEGSTDAVTPASNTDTTPVPYYKVKEELQLFLSQKKTVLTTLKEAAEVVAENVLSELTERRDSGSLVSGQQKSVVDRLVDQVEEAKDKGYRSLSSSSHLLEPVEMSLTLFAKKDKEIAEAFKSALLSFPAREGDISFSLWVSGALIAQDELCKEFPFHLAKYVVEDSDGSSHPNRLPRVIVEVYFSPELYHASQLIGEDGVRKLRRFIGTTMMRQHEPIPTSQSLLLNANEQERSVFNLASPSLPEEVHVPWISLTKHKVASVTGVVLASEDVTPAGVHPERMKETIYDVWKAWGHLVKDLHVCGDLDFLKVGIDHLKEVKENNEYIDGVRQLDEKVNQDHQSSIVNPNNNDLVFSNYKGGHSLTHPNSYKLQTKKKVQHFVPLSADFAVIECCLERKGLPHNMVLEDITKTLAEMQAQSLEMLRFALLDEMELLEDEVDLTSVVPVLYAPKIVVTHAGVIEKGTHSFQQIRIRGSCLAHVEALANALNAENYFTDYDIPLASDATRSSTAATLAPVLPENLSFTNTHSKAPTSAPSSNKRLLGHRLRSSSRGGAGHERQQVTQAFEDRIVSQDERDFWRENYYRLSSFQLLYHNRVDAADALVSKNLNSRLSEHIRLINSKLLGDDVEGGEGSEEKPSRRATTTRRKKNIEGENISPEKMFEYLCTDCEAETAMWDLKVGDCKGYDYRLRLRKIPAKDIEFVEPAVQSLQSKGFINYFGPSRFASYTKHNMHPGLHLLKGEFRAAANIIVQQFYVDAAMEAERRRTGNVFPSSHGRHFPRMVDFPVHGGRRTLQEHGTALQKVLSNALQASLLLNDRRMPDGALMESDLGTDDPCAEAFLNVIGTNACRIIIHEFLSFVWNDIVNQRMKRYGTFALLPGDLVRHKTEVPIASAKGALLEITEVRQNPKELTVVTQKDIDNKLYTPFDVVLPLPGADCVLPDNHTADLYIVTLRRYGIQFNPEDRQWDIFYPKETEEGAPTSSARRRRASASALAAASPYHHLTTSFAKMEEELAYETIFNDTLLNDKVLAVESYHGRRKKDAAVDATAWRKDLRKTGGNALGISINASYRAPLANPSQHLQWRLEKGLPGSPIERWGARRRMEQHSLEATNPHFTTAADPPEPATKAPSAEELNPFALPNGGELITGTSKKTRSHSNAAAKQRGAAAADSLVYDRPKRKYKTLPIPPVPYWVSSHDRNHLDLRFQLPASSYSSMLLRELTKSDVNTSDVVPLQGVAVGEKGVLSSTTTYDTLQQQRKREMEYQQYLSHRRMRRAHFVNRPRAMKLAVLHQQIFRSNGVRQSLLPTLRSYDSVSK